MFNTLNHPWTIDLFWAIFNPTVVKWTRSDWNYKFVSSSPLYCTCTWPRLIDLSVRYYGLQRLCPGVLWLWHFLYTLLNIRFAVSGIMRLAKQETLTPPWHLVSPLVCRGPWISTVVLFCWYHSDSASVLLYFTFTSSQEKDTDSSCAHDLTYMYGIQVSLNIHC